MAVLGGAYLVFQYMMATRPEVVRKPVAEKVYFIDTVTASKRTIVPRLVLYGNIVAGREVELRPLVTGRVVRVAGTFSDGGIVRKGDLLVEIDPFDYRIAVTERKTQLSEAQARLTEIQADLKGEKALIRHAQNQIELRQRDLARRKSLLERGAGTAKLLDDSKLALSSQQQKLDERIRRAATLEARLVQQKAVIARAEWALTRAERNLRDTRLVAPFDGFLSDISTEIGKKVGVNDKIAPPDRRRPIRSRVPGQRRPVRPLGPRRQGDRPARIGCLADRWPEFCLSGDHRPRFRPGVERQRRGQPLRPVAGDGHHDPAAARGFRRGQDGGHDIPGCVPAAG